MARGTDMEKLKDELVEACAWGNEGRSPCFSFRLGLVSPTRTPLSTQENQPSMGIPQLF